MKKITTVLAIILITAITLISVQQKETQEQINAKTSIPKWEELVNTEWSNYDDWAGSGLIFSEDNGEKKCSFVVYGSGVPIIKEYVSLVTVNESNLAITVPNPFGDETTDPKEEVIEFKDGKLIFMNKIYKKIEPR